MTGADVKAQVQEAMGYIHGEYAWERYGDLLAALASCTVLTAEEAELIRQSLHRVWSEGSPAAREALALLGAGKELPDARSVAERSERDGADRESCTKEET